ncbi:hypothetical protein AB0B45_20950 [Nonomuraea sp. NPDC049152]|uniref:hypothetical protein n=1 Tax=Nonomuraea sp. NPDC049152 TaxID=3154350 RepID=UPI0033FC98F5
MQIGLIFRRNGLDLHSRRSVSSGELCFQAGAFVSDAAQALGDLLAWPVRVTDEVEVLVFLRVDLGELFLDLDAQAVAMSGAKTCLRRRRIALGPGGPSWQMSPVRPVL